MISFMPRQRLAEGRRQGPVGRGYACAPMSRSLTATRAAALGACCAGVALVLAGCSGQRDTSEGRRIETVVKQFALSHGREACDLMTHKALLTVYGAGATTPAAARAHCIARSPRFRGAPVDITYVSISSATSAHATAKTPDGRKYFSVGLAKVRGRWLIDAVTAMARPG